MIMSPCAIMIPTIGAPMLSLASAMVLLSANMRCHYYWHQWRSYISAVMTINLIVLMSANDANINKYLPASRLRFLCHLPLIVQRVYERALYAYYSLLVSSGWRLPINFTSGNVRSPYVLNKFSNSI